MSFQKTNRDKELLKIVSFTFIWQKNSNFKWQAIDLNDHSILAS